MTVLLYKRRIIVALGLALVIFLTGGCKKLAAVTGSQSALESLFEENLLNRNFIVDVAIENGSDITNQYSGYNFILTKNTSYDGAITGSRSGITYTGTWASNEDYGKLTIKFTDPATPPEFTFLTRSWRFTKKAVPVMELAPWGSTASTVLHMKRL